MKRTLSYLFAVALACCAGAGRATSAELESLRVSTYAGTGQMGMQDDAVDRASFLLPAGLAQGHDGTVYVSDDAAQRIRAISGGKVTTVAGSGAIGALGFAVEGGYKDGPALEARFNQPLGMAVAGDGAIYIADARNAAIRKLQNGVVTTLVGKPPETQPATAVDGDASVARFVRPMSVAFDPQGRLWIADYGAGLRCWDHGTLKTVTLSPAQTDVISVAVQPDDGTLIVVLVKFVIRYDPKTGVSQAYQTGQTLGEGNTPFGNPSQVAGLGDDQAVFTDPVASTLRYVRFGTPPFVTDIYTRLIAGGGFERHTDNQGYADGPNAAARFSSPRGLIVMHGNALLADSGNRRIRSVQLPHFRLPEGGKSSSYHYDDSHYEVALVGPSWVYFDSSDGDSMCAHIEERLNASGKLGKPARCHTVRIDAASVASTEDYISANLAFRHVDLIVMSIVPGRIYEMDASSQQMAIAKFKASISTLIGTIPAKARLGIFWQYYDTAISNREEIRDVEVYPAQSALSPDFYYANRGSTQNVFNSLEGMPVMQCDSFDAAVAYERGTGPPLYLSDDAHFNVRGNAFYGTLLGDCIAKHLTAR